MSKYGVVIVINIKEPQKTQGFSTIAEACEEVGIKTSTAYNKGLPLEVDETFLIMKLKIKRKPQTK